MPPLTRLISGLCLIILVVIGAPFEARAASTIGAVTLVHEFAYGTVAGEDKAGLFSNDEVYQTQIVETISDGALHIEFIDDTTLRLGSASRMVLDELVYDPKAKGGRLIAHLTAGVFRYISGKIDKAGVRVLTPTVSIAIRGTDFSVTVAPDGTTAVSVAEGEVVVTALAGGDPVAVTPGQIATVSDTASGIAITSGRSVSNDAGLGDMDQDAVADGDNDGGGGGGAY